MFETLRNAWRIKELRKKILYTLFMLLLYRLAGVIPVAGVNPEAVQTAIENFSLLNFMSAMTGGQFSQMTIMAMGITPYINASIIMQLLTVAIPYLENLQKEGEEGRKKIAQYTRYATVVLGFIQAVGLVLGMGAVRADHFSPFITSCMIGVSMAAGTALAMWIGERITENGIGNGISLLIFAGIIASLFQWVVGGISDFVTAIGAGALTVGMVVVAVIIILAVLVMVTAVTFVDMGERRVPVQYAKRVVGRKMYGGQSTHIPMKVNSSGVLPLIFAFSIMQFPGTIMAFWPNSAVSQWWNNSFMNSVWYQLVLAVMIIFFAYFYTSITFNPVDIAKNLQQNGGTIPGIRQGKPTSDYLARISQRITLFGGVFLALLATIPTLVTLWGGIQLPFAASSLLIAVSVSLETTRQLESQMLMRHYKGFL
ncbi:MAG TPA: preprotein translocase subunit SecY [Candidatus Avichristensenella intestinipullorum]|uniref:Protein translocase subunit SecY n=1 Tax=Candidatus Avichristensenella intestinipullorum TaxID=2840693 RepID=A0A9D1CI50_9FIRM|nr:preprotein translocase subunit SecY [Candidatus Avichristensenella intestinipullorum]